MRLLLGLGLLASAALGCAGRPSTPAPTESSRSIGSFQVGDSIFRVHAAKDRQHRDPCEPSFLRSRACTDASIATALVVTTRGRDGEAVAFDPGWSANARVIVASRDTGSSRRIASELDERFAALALVSCTDASHAAYRVRASGARLDLTWTLIAVAHGVAFARYARTDTDDCPAALAEGARFDADFARRLASGDRSLFDAFVRRGALAAAIDFALEHPFEVDVLREPYPLIDEVFFDALRAALQSNPTLSDHLVARLTADEPLVAEGLRRSDAIDAFIAKLVRLLPAESRARLATSLAPICSPASPACPPWRAAALAATHDP